MAWLCSVYACAEEARINTLSEEPSSSSETFVTLTNNPYCYIPHIGRETPVSRILNLKSLAKALKTKAYYFIYLLS